jgi:type I restriction enzyme, R subunit
MHESDQTLEGKSVPAMQGLTEFVIRDGRDLQASHAAIMDFFKAHGLADFADHDAFFDLFYDEDLRFEYISLFKKFTKCLNLVFPAKEALAFRAQYDQLAEINVLAEKHFRDGRLSIKGIRQSCRTSLMPSWNRAVST